jgi:SAM-dependent methyltransferase
MSSAPAPVAAPFACLLCGAGRSRHLFTKHGMGIARCGACGFVQQQPLPDAAAVAAMYADDGHYGDELMHNEALFLDRDRALLAELAARGATGPLLDVGAGAGLLLRAAVERGWDGTGLELSHPSAERIRAALRATVHECTIHDAPLAIGSFGAVTFSHSLEHVLDPVGTLRRARDLLRPGGLVHIAVPNWLAAKRTAAGRHVPWIYPHHITYFRRATLERALAAAGLQPLAWDVRRYPGDDYAFVLALLRRWGLAGPLARWLHMGDRPLEELITEDVRVDCPPWRYRTLLRFARMLLALWPERLLCALGRSDELRVTARRPPAG